MAFDILLRLDKVKGEYDEPAYKDWIHVINWTWGGSNTGTTHMGTGGGSGKVSMNDLMMSKWTDKSSATLLQFLARGTHIDTGELVVRKAGDTAIPFLTIKLKDILVTSLQFGGGGDHERYMEQLILNFRYFSFDYATQLSNGSKGPSVVYAHDIAANKTLKPDEFRGAS